MLIGFVVGLVCGCGLGMLVTSLCVMAKGNSEMSEKAAKWDDYISRPVVAENRWYETLNGELDHDC